MQYANYVVKDTKCRLLSEHYSPTSTNLDDMSYMRNKHSCNQRSREAPTSDASDVKKSTILINFFND